MKKKYKMPAIGLACVCLAVCAAVILKNHSTDPKVQPQLVDTENRMLLEDFFDSGETSAVRHIYYWFNYQKFELTADPQDIERVLAVLKESGYKKLPEEEAPNSAFRRFELVTDSKKFFFGCVGNQSALYCLWREPVHSGSEYFKQDSQYGRPGALVCKFGKPAEGGTGQGGGRNENAH